MHPPRPPHPLHAGREGAWIQVGFGIQAGQIRRYGMVLKQTSRQDNFTGAISWPGDPANKILAESDLDDGHVFYTLNMFTKKYVIKIYNIEKITDGRREKNLSSL